LSTFIEKTNTSGNACGCMHGSMLATAGIVGSSPWSAGGPVEGDTMGECNSAWMDKGGVCTENGCRTFNWCESLHGTRRGRYWRDN